MNSSRSKVGSFFIGLDSISSSSAHAMPFSSRSFPPSTSYLSGMYPFLLRLRGDIAFLGGRLSSLRSLFSWEVSTTFGTQRLRSHGKSLESLIAALSWFPSSATVKCSYRIVIRCGGPKPEGSHRQPAVTPDVSLPS